MPKITNLDNSVGNKPSGETDTLWDKIGILYNNEQSFITQQFRVFERASTQTYYAGTYDITKDGYIPIFVGYSMNQIGLHLYELRLYKEDNDRFKVAYGLTIASGTLSSAILTLEVVYKKVE